MDDTTRNEVIGELDTRWKIQPQPIGARISLLAKAKEVANSLTRWYVQGVVDQQNAFNATVVRALQALSANDDRRHTELSAHIQLLQGHLDYTNQQLTFALRRAEAAEGRVAELERRLNVLEHQFVHHSNHLSDIDAAQTVLVVSLDTIREQYSLEAKNERS